MKKIYYILLLLCCTIVTSVPAYSQVTFGELDDPDSDAVLDLRSGGNKGLLLPRLSLVNVNDPAPLDSLVAGMVIYNIAEGEGVPAQGYYYSDGFQWVQITDTQVASWFDRATDKGATSNLEDIYQTGAVYVGGSATMPHTQFAVMSDTKGALMPRLSAQEIAAIPTGEAPDGLLVFNTSSKCYNYFHGGDMRWVSICPEAAPSAIAIETCVGSGHQGTYQVGKALTNENYYVLVVRVNEAGPYTLRVTTGNGYSFERSGTFTEPGVYTLNLPGQGTPVAPRDAGDVASVFLNGTYIDLENTIGCSLPYIIVNPADLQYNIICAEVPEMASGEYIKGKNAADSNNKITIKIDVTTDGRGAVRTNTVNGVYFESDVTRYDTQGEYSVTLYAKGTPTITGTYTFLLNNTDGTAGVCAFEIDVITNLGTFESPAASCLAILTEDPRKQDGEYYINDSGTATKTFCDMTNGGYTLVWSYSEYTARNTYTTVNSFIVVTYYDLSYNNPKNRIQTDTNNPVNYTDFRLSNSAMRSASSSTTPMIKVRITDNPTDMNDEWAANNYGIVTVQRTAQNPFMNVFSAVGPTATRQKVEGKLWGKRWGQSDGTDPTKPVGTYGGYFENPSGTIEAATYIAWYNTAGLSTHWDFNTGAATTGSTLFEVIPDRGGANNKTSIICTNNMFGWFGESQPNHHFGKCGGTSGDDYSFATQVCSGSTLVPHSFNMVNGNYQGRYLQWWVK